MYQLGIILVLVAEKPANSVLSKDKCPYLCQYKCLVFVFFFNWSVIAL